MAKKEISKEILDLREELKENRLLIGFKIVLKNLKEEALNKVYLASNCPGDIKRDIERYCELVNVPIVILKMDNEEIGVFCKKHFYISVLGVKK